ncbi:drug resistance transporter, EmrB/QacA subfamily [Sporobacter termitidis DSM 10068]|uniref:Drug resistance transporter, EmrB/QacA subfamily n=1 Tax=Sporobacter termitidis DSM 10068 TaxID=1123282 RepID=A0A1M5Z8S9_9FIRM|nr:MDR family MFS transporter [Sporobacter termitidis]SHI20640.1 drug resistance transporter, EmrB/QacA subfamily [Sporobacter termitidis DSM 10068]
MKTENIHGTRLVLIIVSLMASLLLAALDSTIVGTAMKTIINELHGMEHYAWPFTIYMLCSTVVIPISGGLADIFGRKPIFLIGIFTFLVGSVFCGLSQSMLWLILFRGVQGLGGGILTTSVFTVVADLFPPQQRGKYMGIVTSVFGLSSIIGPLIGGLITDYMSWRWIFYINIPIGVAALVLIVLFMPNFKAQNESSKVDYPGALFIVLTLVPMLLAFSFAGTTYAWGSVQIIGMFALSAVMLVLFVVVESRSENPIIPMTFFKDRAIWVTLLVAFLSNAVMYAAIMYIPYFVQGILGTSATTSGAVTVPMTIALMVTSNFIGILATNKSNLFRFFTVLAFAASAAGLLLLSRMTVATTYMTVIINMVILGGGIGLTMPIANINVQNAAPIEQLAAATGATQFFRTIGSTIGSAIFGTIMTSSIARGFMSLDLTGVPAGIQSALKDPQMITNKEALGQLVSQTPPEQAGAVGAAVDGAKNVLLGGIHDVFLFCTIVAVAGIVLSVFFKSAPMKIIHAGRPSGDASPGPAPGAPEN